MKRTDRNILSRQTPSSLPSDTAPTTYSEAGGRKISRDILYW